MGPYFEFGSAGGASVVDLHEKTREVVFGFDAIGFTTLAIAGDGDPVNRRFFEECLRNGKNPLTLWELAVKKGYLPADSRDADNSAKWQSHKERAAHMPFCPMVPIGHEGQ